METVSVNFRVNEEDIPNFSLQIPRGRLLDLEVVREAVFGRLQYDVDLFDDGAEISSEAAWRGVLADWDAKAGERYDDKALSFGAASAAALKTKSLEASTKALLVVWELAHLPRNHVGVTDDLLRQLLTALRTNRELQELAATAFWKLVEVSSRPELAERIAVMGTAKDFLSVLQGPQPPQVAAIACGAMWALCVKSESSRRLIATVQGLKMVASRCHESAICLELFWYALNLAPKNVRKEYAKDAFEELGGWLAAFGDERRVLVALACTRTLALDSPKNNNNNNNNAKGVLRSLNEALRIASDPTYTESAIYAAHALAECLNGGQEEEEEEEALLESVSETLAELALRLAKREDSLTRVLASIYSALAILQQQPTANTGRRVVEMVATYRQTRGEAQRALGHTLRSLAVLDSAPFFACFKDLNDILCDLATTQRADLVAPLASTLEILSRSLDDTVTRQQRWFASDAPRVLVKTFVRLAKGEGEGYLDSWLAECAGYACLALTRLSQHALLDRHEATLRLLTSRELFGTLCDYVPKCPAKVRRAAVTNLRLVGSLFLVSGKRRRNETKQAASLTKAVCFALALEETALEALALIAECLEAPTPVLDIPSVRGLLRARAFLPPTEVSACAAGCLLRLSGDDVFLATELLAHGILAHGDDDRYAPARSTCGYALLALAKLAADSRKARLEIASLAPKLAFFLVVVEEEDEHEDEEEEEEEETTFLLCLSALRVLLNCSVELEACRPLAVACLDPLVRLSRGFGEERDLAVSVLSNVSRDAHCISLMHLAKLRSTTRHQESVAASSMLTDETLFVRSPGRQMLLPPSRNVKPEDVWIIEQRRRKLLPLQKMSIASTASSSSSLEKAELRLAAALGWRRPSRQVWEENSLTTVEGNYFTTRMMDKKSKTQKIRSPRLPAPRPGSHRVGVAFDRNGESPWQPPLLAAIGLGATDDVVDKVMTLAPGGSRNTFIFKQHSGAAARATREQPTEEDDDFTNHLLKQPPKRQKKTKVVRRTETQLACFKHVPGSKIGETLFPTYSIDGELCHLFCKSRICSEIASNNGHQRWRPSEGAPCWDPASTEWAHFKKMTVPTARKYVAAGTVSVAEAPRCPPIERHYMDHLVGTPEAPYGELPASCLDFTVQRRRRRAAVAAPLKKKKKKKKQATLSKQPYVFRLEDTIFAPRVQECDARGFYNTPALYNKMLALDFERMLELPRFPKWVSKLCGESPNETVQALKDGLCGAVYKKLTRLFMSYGIHQQLGQDPFSVGLISFLAFCKETGLSEDPRVTGQVMERIFVQVNVEVGQAKKLAKLNSDSALMRYEWIEAILRLLEVRYDWTQPVSAATINESMELFQRDHLSRVLLVEEEEEEDDGDDSEDRWRRSTLYTQAVNEALVKYATPLREVYEAIANANPTFGQPTFKPNEWLSFLKQSGMLLDKSSRTDALSSFMLSRMRFVDEAKHFYRSMSWVTFLEGICRVVADFVVPAAWAMKELQVTEVTEFYEAICALAGNNPPGTERAQRTKWLLEVENNHGGLDEKLSLMLPYILQNFAISHHGVLETKTRKLKLDGCLTAVQRKRWLRTHPKTTISAVEPLLAVYAIENSRMSTMDMVPAASAAVDDALGSMK